MSSNVAGVSNRPKALAAQRKWGPGWSVRALMSCGFGLLVVIVACIAVGGAWQIRLNQSDLAELEHHSTTASQLQNVEAEAGISALLLQRYVDAGDDSYVQEINDHAAAAQQSLQAALLYSDLPEIGALTASGSTLVGDAARTVALKQAGDSTGAKALLEEIVPIFRDYRLQLQTVAARELDRVDQLRRQAEATGERAFWLLVGAGILGVISGIIASVWIARLIMKPLALLEDTAHQVSAGDLSARAPSTGPKELAHLGSVLNEMMKAIETRTADLGHANNLLNDRNRDLIDARNQAATDPLTGLGNHRSFHKSVREEVVRAQKTGVPLGLLMIDVDGFKSINDSFGHQQGDQLLQDLTRTLSDIASPQNTFRYGGDELAVIVPGANGSQTAEVAERLRAAVCEMAGLPVTISLGVACFPETATSAEGLVYRADMAMYWAKSSGKNRVENWASIRDKAPAGPGYSNGRSDRRDFVAALRATLRSEDDETRRRAELCARYVVELGPELGISESELAGLLTSVAKSTGAVPGQA